MSIRHLNWYNLNAQRPYPLDESASLAGDDGKLLRHDVLVDAHLRWPDTAGQFAFISGITVTENIVTVVLSLASGADSAPTFVPLGYVSLTQPVLPYQHYPITALIAGAGGFLVFDDVREAYSIRFSGPAQSRIMMRCARAEPVLPIQTLRKLGRVTGLQDIVELRAGSDIEIVHEELLIDDCIQSAVVIRLVQNATRNVLADYIGPCGIRPESRNCAKEGIETVNGVGPDCNGNLNIKFSGLLPGPYDSCGGGVTLDQDLGIDDVCVDRSPIRFPGTDYCLSSDSSADSESSGDSDSGDSDTPAPSADSVSEESVQCADLPYQETFDDGVADGFIVKIGTFAIESFDVDPDDEAGSTATRCYSATDGSRRNVSVFENCGLQPAIEKTVVTAVSLTSDTPKQNGGIVLNYRIADPLTNPHVEYLLVSLDRNAGKLRLLRFTGLTFVEEHAVAVSPVVLGHWYVLQVTVQAVDADTTLIHAEASSNSDETWPDVSFSVHTNSYLPADGSFGLGSDRAHARFGYFYAEEG